MRLIEFLSAVNIFEAAKDRYAQMFTNLVPMFKEIGKDEEYESYVNGEIEWAMNTLKKQDKIIWYLRFVKLDMLKGQTQPASTPEQHRSQPGVDWNESAAKFQPIYYKALKQLAGKMGIPAIAAEEAAEDAVSQRFKRNMEHFMSLELPALEQYVFANQTPEQIISDWTPVEQAWQAKRSELVDIDRDDVDTLIKYPDGSEWVNLNKNYCQEEGQAMGHCGNSAQYDENHTVLSYRTIEDVDGEEMWKPRLTFILDTKTGLLGETKGRANQKPAEKYHDVIVDLLRHDFVKGIKGGGYEAENNFKLADLPQDVAEKLIEEKPGLADIEYDYNKRGMTKDLLARMEALWEDTETKFPEYHKPTPAEGQFRHDTRYTIDEFLEHYGGHQAKWVANILNGNDHLDISYSGAPIDDLWYALPPKTQHQVGEWIIDEHSDFVEEWKEDNDKDYDGTDERDTWSIIYEYGIDEITDALERGHWRGDEIGAESAMYESLKSWLEDLPNEYDLSFELSPGWDGSEGHQELIIPEATMVDIVSNHLDEVSYAGDLDRFPNFKELESPYNGWQDYDEEAAKEEAEEQLYEAGVLSQ